MKHDHLNQPEFLLVVKTRKFSPRGVGSRDHPPTASPSEVFLPTPVAPVTLATKYTLVYPCSSMTTHDDFGYWIWLDIGYGWILLV